MPEPKQKMAQMKDTHSEGVIGTAFGVAVDETPSLWKLKRLGEDSILWVHLIPSLWPVRLYQVKLG